MPPINDEVVPYYETADGETARLYHGDVRDVLASLPSGSVHCCITSPPYFGLRVYGNDSREIGLEETPQQYVENLVSVFGELRRVLRLDGTLWLNQGDSYATATKGSGGNKGASTLQMDGRSDHARINGARRTIERQKSEVRKFHYDVPEGSLLGIPWMTAFALQESGWILRQDIIWHKLGSLPEPATNRCVNNYEHVFLFARNSGYYFDHIAIAEKSASEPYANRNSHLDGSRNDQSRKGEVWGYGLTNKRSVWSIANCNPEASKRHFASWPAKLIEPMILAGTSEYGCCVKCGSPYKRVIEKEKMTRDRPNDYVKRNGEEGTGNVCDNSVAGVYVRTVGWKKTCVCDCDEVMPCTVLDPFLGTGTTVTTAITHGRNGIGIELNEDYLKHDAVPRVKKLLLSRPAWRELA